MRAAVRRCLAWGVLLSLLLPTAVAVVAGLAALLASLGDRAGATACGRVALVLGTLWLVALAATATAGGMLTLDRCGADDAEEEVRAARRPAPGRDDDRPAPE